MNAVLADLLHSGFALAPSGDPVAVQDAISEDEGTYLQSLVRSIGATRSLEIGLAHGVSALYICEALTKTPATRHIVIDPFQRRCAVPHVPLGPDGFNGVGLHNLHRAGYGSFIDFREQPSHVALPALLAEGVTVDFAFIDGMHTLDYALVDFFYVDKLLRVGGIVCFDDANYPALRKLCRYVATNVPYKTLFSPISDPPPRLRQRLLRPLLRHATSLIRPELARTDADLGLSGTCIAFEKIADDTRAWDVHRPF